MDRFSELSILVAVAEEEGFSSAARRFSISPPSVSRAVAGLEARLGVMLLSRVVNLAEEGFDAGVRIGTLPDSSLRAMKVGSVKMIVCALPDYLQKHGEPKTQSDLSKHTIITNGSTTKETRWKLYDKHKSSPVSVQPRLSVTNNDAALTAAIMGFGITRLATYQAAAAIAEGKLNVLLEQFEPPPIPVQVIHREGRVASSKVRAFVGLMVERLRADKSLNP